MQISHNCFIYYWFASNLMVLNVNLTKFLDFLLSMSLNIPAKHTSSKEIQNIIHKLPVKKAPGHDLINNLIVKNLPNNSIIFLLHIFNFLLRLSYFPKSWKKSVIILILKPVSLLPTLSKIFEKFLLKRLIAFSTQFNIIPNHQFGFRSNHTTIYQLHRTADIIFISLEEKKYCVAVLLDVAQVFDHVWHEGLLYKLKKFLPAPYFLLIKSYLENRSFVVRVNNCLSSQFPILVGVPQGSNITPFLQSIFVHDISKSYLIIIHFIYNLLSSMPYLHLPLFTTTSQNQW